MKATVFASAGLLLALSLSSAADLQKFTVNADGMAEGDPPKEVFVVDGTIKIAAKDGNKAIMIDPNPITDASAQLAVSASGSATIKARVFGSRRARSLPKFGVSVHGMSGYRLMIDPPKKQVELVKGEEVLEAAPFAWKPDTWTWLSLEVKKAEGDQWTITGKAWDADAKEPAEPSVKHADKGLKGQGKAGIWGTPYSDTPLYFDDIEIGVETAPAAQ